MLKEHRNSPYAGDLGRNRRGGQAVGMLVLWLIALAETVKGWASSNRFGPWLYAGRTTLAALLALYLAFALELDSPYSAGATVLLVANPMHGIVWVKSLYRGIGTVVGGLAAIGLTAAFGQDPMLFLMSFGLWMGICTAASTLLHSFRSYSAVLAGFTVGLISFPTLPDAPETIFTLVAARVSTVMLGIVCTAVVGSLLSRRSGAQVLEARLKTILAELCVYIGQTLTHPPSESQAAHLNRLRSDISTLDVLVESAASEGRRAGGLVESQRASVAAMFATLTIVLSVRDAVGAVPDNPAREAFSVELNRLAQALRTLPSSKLPTEIEISLAFFSDLRKRFEEDQQKVDLALLRLFDRLDELLEDLGVALCGLLGLLRNETGAASQARPSLHTDVRWALINGARATLAIWLASALWAVTAWSSGGLFVGSMVPIIGLLSMRDRPDLDALEFIKGVFFSVIAGLVCLLFVLPNFSNFPELALGLGAFMMWGLMQTTNPQRIFMGNGFLVYFMIILGPANAMRYDLSSYLNGGGAALGATILAALVHRTVLPVRPLTHVRSLVQHIREDLWRLTGHRRPQSRDWAVAWETRMHDCLLQLAAKLRAAEWPDDRIMSGAHGALRLGREVTRLQGLLPELSAVPAAEDAGRAALRGLGYIPISPGKTVRLCRLAAARLGRLAAEQPPQQAAILGRTAFSLIEIAFLVGRHRRFLSRSQSPC